MHPLQEFFDHGLILGDIYNFLTARIQRGETPERIVLPRSELGRVEGKLQTILAFAQQTSGPTKLRHERVDLDNGCSARQQRAALSRSYCGASGIADRVPDNPAQ